MVRGVARAAFPSIRASFRMMAFLVFIGLIGLNIATLVSSRVFDALSSAVSALTDRPTVAKRHAATKAELDRERRTKARLERRVASQTRTLRRAAPALRATTASLLVARADLRSTMARNADLQNKVDESRRRVRSTATKVRSRVLRKTVTLPATVTAASVPFLGSAVVVTQAGVELYLACETMEAMDDLMLFFDEAPDDDDTSRVCGIPLPDASSVWATVKMQSRDTVAEAMQSLHDLAPQMPEVDLPEFPSVSFHEWIEYWQTYLVWR